MSATLILSIVLLAAALVGMFARRSIKRELKARQAEFISARNDYESHRTNRVPETPSSIRHSLTAANWTTSILAVLGLTLLAFNCMTTVTQNTVAVETAFGKPIGVLTPGWHAKAPWIQTEEFSTRIQNSNRLAATNEGDKAAADCVTVKASGVSACVDASIPWSINYDPANVDQSQTSILQLWRSYGNFDSITANLIRRKTETAFSEVYGKYQPQDAFSGALTADIGTKITDELNSMLNPFGIEVAKFAPGATHLADDDQARLNRLFTADQDVEIAKKAAKAAEQQSFANKALNGSLTPEILVQRCFDAAREIKPTVFDCNLTGTSSTPVIVSPKTN